MKVKLVKADAVEYMRTLAKRGESFDLVICDPPKLAPSRSALDKAKNKYIKINAQAMAVVKPGGLLLTCTCSAAVTQGKVFKEFIAEAAKLAKRDVTIISTHGAGPDHPTHMGYPESEYLTAMLLRLA